jgi:hypothetical protein
MSKEIPLTQGKLAIVDDDDYEELSQYQWYAKCSYSMWYAVRDVGKVPHRKHIRMHRVIAKVSDGLSVDHINGDSLDNRKENLRICTHKENSQNRKMPSNNTSGYKGVSVIASGKYQASIGVNGELIYLGLFGSAKQAALAYDKAAIEYHGRFSNTNF